MQTERPNPTANWAGTHSFRATKWHRPSSMEEVQEAVRHAPHIRVLGTGHSFNGIADSEELMTLEGLPPDVVVDHGAGTASFGAGVLYADLVEALNAQGVALHNLPSIPHFSAGGAIATAVHGSGDGNGNLATAVVALELVTSSGEIITASHGDVDFDGMVVGLGALGVVTRITLQVEPAYALRQRVYDRLPWESLFTHLDEIMAAGYSVSIFTDWGATAGQAWVKNRVSEEAERLAPDLFGAAAADGERHPRDFNPAFASPQLGLPGAWCDHLPHIRKGRRQDIGDQLQSEYMVPRWHGIPALRAVRALADAFRPLLIVTEIRSVAPDHLWMSPQYECDTLAIHFSWTLGSQPAVEKAVAEIEAALAPFEARPHWGKYFLHGSERIARLYPRRGDFVDLIRRLDPRGAFRNEWLETHVLGAGVP